MKISGLVITVWIRLLSLALGLGVALVAPAASQSLPRLTGDYVCAYGCRLTDANPRAARPLGPESLPWSLVGHVDHLKSIADARTENR